MCPFGRLWYAELNAISNAINYAKFFSRSHDAVIRVYEARLRPCVRQSCEIRASRESSPRCSYRNRRVSFRRTRMIPEEQNKALDSWQTSARYWEKYRVLIAQMFAPLTSGLVEGARIGISQEVLDIGGGGGEPSLTIS